MLISMLVSLKSSNVFLVISPFYPTSGFNHHVAKEVELNKNWSPFGSLKLPKKIGGGNQIYTKNNMVTFKSGFPLCITHALFLIGVI